MAGLPADVLLVEDNYIIALDTTDMLREIGVGDVRVAHGVADALRAIAERRPAFVFLDVNLGENKCFEIAVCLREAAIPFAFATGYGSSSAFPVDFGGVRIVAKPYTVAALRAAMAP